MYDQKSIYRNPFLFKHYIKLHNHPKELPRNIIISKSFQDDFFDEEEEIDIEYSNNNFSPKQQFQDGFIYPLRGGIFEFKHDNYDIVVRNG